MLFCFELTVASLVRSGYFASLYFWIDLAATLSMLLDITRLMDLIFRQSTMAGSPALTREPQNDVWPSLLQTCCGARARLSTVKNTALACTRGIGRLSSFQAELLAPCRLMCGLDRFSE